MTEDPIKLYVVVMAILVCVLGWVAYTSYDQARAFEQAIEESDRMAAQLKEHASQVSRLCEQLGGSKLGVGTYLTLIEDAANAKRVVRSRLQEESEKRIGSKGIERRFKIEIRSSGANARPLTRETLAEFCRQVERDSRGILKTIEIQLRRYSGASGIPAGSADEVVNDTYTGTIIFGLRVLRS